MPAHAITRGSRADAVILAYAKPLQPVKLACTAAVVQFSGPMPWVHSNINFKWYRLFLNTDPENVL